MNRDGHKDANFFIGGEVEKTPAYAKKTLFVIGRQNLDEIFKLAKENKVSHVFMGANHSYKATYDAKDTYWNDTITALLDKGYWVTLDYPAQQHGNLLNLLSKGVWQSRLFVPLLSIRIPHVQTSNPNLTIKIDDINFKFTNPGVWCLHHHEATDSNRFTDWSEYDSDVVIGNINLKSEIMPVSSSSDVITEDKIKTPVLDTAKNNPELGLDTQSISMLREDPAEIISKVETISDKDAADLYAVGAKEDPLNTTTRKTIRIKK